MFSLDSQIFELTTAKFNSMTFTIIFTFTLIISGVRDENVRAYTPKIVRIGLKAHHSVNSVAMDHLVRLFY